jgi:hypothetical protein
MRGTQYLEESDEREELLLSLFYGQENRGPGKFSKLPRVT